MRQMLPLQNLFKQVVTRMHETVIDKYNDESAFQIDLSKDSKTAKLAKGKDNGGVYVE